MRLPQDGGIHNGEKPYGLLCLVALDGGARAGPLGLDVGASSVIAVARRGGVASNEATERRLRSSALTGAGAGLA